MGKYFLNDIKNEQGMVLPVDISKRIWYKEYSGNSFVNCTSEHLNIFSLTMPP